MRQIIAPLVGLIVGLSLLMLTATAPLAGECQFKFQNCGARATGPTTRVITNINRQRLGDLYTPVPGERTQIRDNNLKILGYIEPSGRITNTNRQEIGSIKGLFD